MSVGNNGRIPGRIKWYNKTKGYGFVIRTDQADNDVFVHYRDLPTGVEDLVEGQSVTFELAATKMGFRAVNIVLG